MPSHVSRRATAGLSLGDAAIVVADDDAEALAAAALIAIEARESAPERARRGIEYVRRAHAPAAYLAAIDQALTR